MLRRAISAFALFALISAVGFASTAGHPKEGAALEAEGEKPNIVLIMTDDLDTASMSRLPRLRSMMASQGTTFRNSFVTTSLCCPSRASTLRGQYAHNHGVKGQTRPDGGHFKFRQAGHEDSNLATWLDDAGYRTSLVGKYLNGYADSYVPPGWDEWYAQIGRHIDSRYSDNGTITREAGGTRLNTDVLAGKAIDSIKRAEEDPSPLFLYLALNAPHQPATPAPRHDGKFAKAGLPQTPSFNERDVSDKPKWIRDQSSVTPNTVASMRELHRNRLETMLSVEDALERIIATLRANGELENTYIVFTSDNGFHMGQHRLKIGKMTAYEEDIRVPLIVRGPDVPAGKTMSHMALNNDLAPTFAELGGAEMPSFVDGRSLAPLLGESPPPTTDWRTAFMSENWRVETPSGLWPAPSNFALRGPDYTYVKYVSNERELYYLRADPYQLRSRHKNSPPSHLRHMNQRHDALRGCAGETCRTAEDAPSPAMSPPHNGRPSITQPSPRPGAKIKSRSPRIAATVRDRQTNLTKNNVRLYLDGRRISRFSYSPRTDRLIHATRRLSAGTHTARVIAVDGSGARAVKVWRFKVSERR